MAVFFYHNSNEKSETLPLINHAGDNRTSAPTSPVLQHLDHQLSMLPPVPAEVEALLSARGGPLEAGNDNVRTKGAHVKTLVSSGDIPHAFRARIG
jgi:hypothetical protein